MLIWLFETLLCPLLSLLFLLLLFLPLSLETSCSGLWRGRAGGGCTN